METSSLPSLKSACVVFIYPVPNCDPVSLHYTLQHIHLFDKVSKSLMFSTLSLYIN